LNSRTAQSAAAYGGAEGILDFNFYLRCGQPYNLRGNPASAAFMQE
jgi:hypothetical protein